MKRSHPLLALALCAAGCPPPQQEPVDARVFISTIFEASVVCFPSFLNEAEPVFLERQAQGQIDAAVAKFEKDLENPAVEFSRAAYDRCLEVARANDCDLIGSADGPCASVFRGRLNASEVCAENVECASGLGCFQELGACGTCEPLAVVGGDCTAANCESGATCEAQTQRCAPLPDPVQFNEGQPCTPQPGCGGLSSGLVCLEGACAPIVVVGEGDACEIGIGASRHCRDSASTHLCEGNVCTARPGLGEPCSSVGACDATEAACVDGACVDDGEPGDACTNGFGCQLDSTCQQQVCTALNDNPQPPVCD